MAHRKKSKISPRDAAVLSAVVAVFCLIVTFSSRGNVRLFTQGLVASIAAGGCALHFGTLWQREEGGRKQAAGATGIVTQKASASLDGLLLRSDDVILTLRDLVSHGQEEPNADYGLLPALLVRAGLMDWEGAPAVGTSRLRRNGRWWLAPRTATELTDADYDRLISIEAALNVYEDLASRPALPQGGSEGSVAQILSTVADLEPLAHPGEQALGYFPDSAEKGGEWDCRVRFSSFVENVPTPFRSVADFRANVAAGALYVETLVPRPSCLALAAVLDPRGQARLARAYALRTALLLGRGALASSSALAHVVVNCREKTNADVLLSLDLTREALERLRAASRGPHALDGGLPADPALRWAAAEDGWLTGVEPFCLLDDEALNPPERHREVELDDSPCPDPLARATGAREMSDLGIMEKAGRVSSWNALVVELGDTTQGAVSRLVGLRDRTADLSVAEACTRTSRALVDGTLDVTNKPALAKLFVDGGTLGAAARHVREVLDTTPAPDELEAALGALDLALSPITQMGLYLDDHDSVYRYFNSVSERISYNRTCDDQGRRVRLVPDEYYGAHSIAARGLSVLNRADEALAHTDELMRVAPMTPDAALAKVRCLEDQSRIFEAVDLLKGAIERSSTARDMAICFYRLAYMEWKLGRSDLAVACYQRSLTLHLEMAEQTRRELADMLEADRNLRVLADDQVLPTLEAGGIPTGDLGQIRQRTLDALIACTDAEVFSVARPLTGALLDIGRDDVLVDVYHSLARPQR